jgi:hypothetical protein
MQPCPLALLNLNMIYRLRSQELFLAWKDKVPLNDHFS